MARRTIERESRLSGIGLHTGVQTTAILRPAVAGRGIVFRRTDLAGTPEIPARLSEVEATERRTSIGKGNATIHTVEHLLAAVTGLGIDDLEIGLDGPEPPILDGSFQPWFKALS
ncbi:MAG: UDP-3-O-acyl-N-acetylglucosamine deacetylase, partial [Gemmatimonadota bacterium]